MRRFTLFFFALFAFLMAGAQSSLPDLSTEDAPTYYPIKFQTGGAYLGDQGAGKNMLTVASSSDATQFQLIGTQSSFILKSKLGNYVAFNTTKSRFTTTATKSGAVKLRIINGKTNKYYELQREDQSQCMNQYGGQGAGKELSEYTVGDVGNQLYFEGASNTLADMQTQYDNLVSQIRAAAAYKYFHTDATEAVNAIPATTPTTKADLQAAITKLEAALAALNTGTRQGTEIEGKQFFISSKAYPNLFMYSKGTSMGRNGSKYMKNHLWVFEKVEGQNGKYLLKNVGDDLYVAPIPTANNKAVSLVSSKDEAGVYTVVASATNGYCMIYDESCSEANRNSLHMQGDGDNIVRWEKTSEPSQFMLNEADNFIASLDTYYTIKNGKGGYVSLQNGYSDSKGLTLSNSKAPSSLDGLWHLIKNADNTYSFISAGTTSAGKILGIKGSEGSARTNMYDTNELNSTITTNFDGTFVLDGTQPSYIKLVGSSNNYLNNRDGYLALWNSSLAADGDQGSQFYITPIVPNDEFIYAEFNTVEAGTRPTDISDYALWYNVPVAHTNVSDTWMEYALPLGNGQIGATIRGGLYKDEIQFNEKTLFEGTNGYCGSNSDQEAQGRGWYQNFGSIMVVDKSNNFSLNDDSKPAKSYVRYLDIMNGVGGVNYKSSDEATTYTRRYFTSATDKVLVAHYEANGTDKLNLKFTYQPDARINASEVTYNDATATFSGKLNTVSYNTALKVFANDGATITTGEDGIRVSNAQWAYVMMAAATDYDATKKGCVSGASAADIATTVQNRLAAASAKDYTTLYNDHVAAFSNYMNRVDLKLATPCTDKTTEDLVKYYATDANKTTNDGLYLESLYFQYGRYMTIGANLDGSIHAPSNLQGIWNDRSNTQFWHCDIHADINVQMNYWPADPTNLSEMHLPFLNHIIDMASAPNSPWVALAQRIKSGAKGWTVAVENNIFGGSTTWCNGSIKTLGAWYCDHLWRYYKYTLDRDFLKRAIPVMYQNALFTKSIATKDSKGLYEIKGEWSPEHGPSDVTAFAQQTAYQGLKDLYLAHEALGDESPITAAQMTELDDLYKNFDKGLWVEQYNPGGVNWSEKKPCISEWKNNALSEPGHRHLSHLMCLYPFNQVSAFATDADGVKFFQAAYNGQIARNGDVTGWSMGWQTNTYARALDSDKAHYNLQRALKHSTAYDIQMAGQGGCYYNLFDSHSPFQIDGNYGCTSGVAEMLLQSYDDVITILPALPSAWPNGSVKGLKAQGNYNVDEEWTDGKATSAKVTNNLQEDRTVKVRYNNIVKAYDIKAGDTLELDLTNGLPTAIATITNGVKTQKSIFDLSGRRVSKTAKGVYIVDGQKVIF